NETTVFKTSAICSCRSHLGLRRTAVNKSNHRHCGLLRARRERPRRRAAEKCNEIAPHHCRCPEARTALYRLNLGDWKRPPWVRNRHVPCNRSCPAKNGQIHH